MNYAVNGIFLLNSYVATRNPFREQCTEIVKHLRAERERLGLSKYVVEQRCGVSRQMIAYVERGLRQPSLELALRLADGIGVDLGSIIKKTRPTAAARKSKSAQT